MRFVKNIKNRILPHIIVYFAKMAMRVLLFTCKVEIEGLDQFVKTAKKERCMITLWHNRLAIMPEILKKYASQFVYCAFISKSRDGELLAILAKSYTMGRTLRVSHNHRRKALNDLINQLKKGEEIMVVTPDGPRGPRYQVKAGAVIAAKEAEASIIPVSWSSSRFFQLKSWDKLMLPKPFSKIIVVFGDPLNLDKDSNLVGEHKSLLKQSLLHLDIQVCAAVSSNSERWPK
jgi:lysophospholipid acyltransferase (LPLAT)-like uncharacterized protein